MVNCRYASRYFPSGDRMIFRIAISITAVVLLLIMGAGCSRSNPTDGDPGGGGATKDAAFYVEAAWEQYDLGDMEVARNQFNHALSQDSTYVPAISGKAWVNLEFGYTGLALSEFEEALELTDGYIPALCGQAITSHAEALNIPPRAAERLGVTVEAASRAIAIGGEGWQFDRIGAINARHMRVLLAISYYELADYSSAQGQIDLLDPGNDLTASGDDYLRLLLIAIENQRGQI